MAYDATMTVKQLREKLADLPDDTLVYFQTYRGAGFWKVEEVGSVSPVNERGYRHLCLRGGSN